MKKALKPCDKKRIIGELRLERPKDISKSCRLIKISRSSLHYVSIKDDTECIQKLGTLTTGIIVCHNHPSGNINLSTQDKIITNRIKEIGQLLEIRLLDHLVITPTDKYVSMSDENLI